VIVTCSQNALHKTTFGERNASEVVMCRNKLSFANKQKKSAARRHLATAVEPW